MITKNSGQGHWTKKSSEKKDTTSKPRVASQNYKKKQRHPDNRKRPAGQSYNYNTRKEEKLRIIPIGGCEEVGRNMTVFEYAGDIVILDMGLQFPEEDMPGIDYIIPNTKYLEGKERNIRGVIFSHGHLDHIGASPILLEKLGNPPILGMDLTLAMVKHKVEDYKKNTSKNLKTIRIKNVRDVIRLGSFTIKFFQIEHSIMDAVGVIIETPSGSVIHPGDWSLGRDKNGKPTVDYTQLGKNLKKPTVLMLESLGVVHKENRVDDETMYKNLLEILKEAPGRIIIGTFSSQIERIKWVIDAAGNLGKKVALDGYSMKMNVELAQKFGYLKIKKGVLIDIKQLDKVPDKKSIVIGTGAQGEENAVLARIVNGDHRHVNLKKDDTVIFSSSVIPGNERTIQRLKDNMYRQCDNVVHGEFMDVHVSGHATQKDILEVIRQIQPTYFIPVYAHHYMLKETRNLAIKNGFPKEKIFVPDNGSVIEVTQREVKMLEKKVPSHYVFVDGLGVSDTQNIVLRDRQVLAGDGMVVVIITVRNKTGELVQNPDIISRGFVFLKDNKVLIEDLRHKVKHMVIKSNPKTWVDSNMIKNDIRDKVGQFLYTKTEKRPMVLPVVIEV
ncbi:ribonuclease J [Patescibacteria group bacterium]|nr:ribonuclease J [Patescibacteria group bacterium]MBU1895609.1 ribonuclease J [Patescibacteria group bacterium]